MTMEALMNFVIFAIHSVNFNKLPLSINLILLEL